MQDSVEYLGYHIDKEGLHSTNKNVEAVQRARTPRNLQELRSFLELVHFYGKFIYIVSTILQPLNQLLQNGRQCGSTPACA